MRSRRVSICTMSESINSDESAWNVETGASEAWISKIVEDKKEGVAHSHLLELLRRHGFIFHIAFMDGCHVEDLNAAVCRLFWAKD